MNTEATVTDRSTVLCTEILKHQYSDNQLIHQWSCINDTVDLVGPGTEYIALRQP